MFQAFQLFLLALLGSVIALFGGFVFLFNRRLSGLLERHSIPFAAGVLVTVSLLGLLPESEHIIGENAFWIVAVSFLGAYLFEHFFFVIHHHEDGEHVKGMEFPIPLVIIGDTIHNFIDGVAIAASFFISPGLGLVTAISTFLHEVPHEIGDFGILLKAGWKKGKIVVVNILSSLTTILGAFLIYFFSESESLNGTLMAVSAGIFLYLGASDFLPKIEKDEKHRFRSIIPLILGASLMIAIFLLVPHEH